MAEAKEAETTYKNAKRVAQQTSWVAMSEAEKEE